MKNHNLTKLVILIDLRNHLIRIHKNTLHALGNPDYVLLLINPDKLSLMLAPCNSFEPKAHYIANSSFNKGKSCELYSKPLIKSLKNICNHWKEGQPYLLKGEIITNKGVALFNMKEATLMNNVKP